LNTRFDLFLDLTRPLPISAQLVVHQNSDGTTSTTTTNNNPSGASNISASLTNPSSSSTASTTNSSNSNQQQQQQQQQQQALVLNHQGQLISLPVLQTQQGNSGAQNITTATTLSGFNSAGSSSNNQLVQAVNLSSLNFASLANNSNSNANTIQLQSASLGGNNRNTVNNGTTPIKTLLEEDDKSDTSIDDQGPTIANMPTHSSAMASGHVTHATTVDGVNLDEIREFAKAFKLRRLALGLTQTQVGQALSATKGPAYSQSAICRFEKLDITPKSAAKIKPVLEKWMQEAELKYADRLKSGSHQNFADLLGSESTKKRKRRTSFTPQALEILNEYFEKNTHPSDGNQGADMTMLANKLNYDREVIRVWFCNKRQALKNTLKKLKQNNGDGSIDGQSEVSLSPNSSALNPQSSGTANQTITQINTMQTSTPTKTVITLTNNGAPTGGEQAQAGEFKVEMGSANESASNADANNQNADAQSSSSNAGGASAEQQSNNNDSSNNNGSNN
jgi:class 6 POU domain transcription factor